MPETQASAYPGLRRYAFVDAYGDPSLKVEKTGVTTSFIVAAIVCDGANVDTLLREVDAVRARHFGSGPMKSAQCSDERRLKVLGSLSGVDFRYVAVAIDKSRIPGDGGLVFREPFVKFVHRKLFDRLFRAMPFLHVIADRYGNEEFMEGFKEYVLRHQQADLFRTAAFDFRPSSEDPRIQLADFIAGSLARLYDPKKRSDESINLFRDALLPKALFVTDWPKRYSTPDVPRPGGSPHDATVRRYCLDQVQSFLGELGEPEDSELALVVETLRHLLFSFHEFGEDEYIATKQIVEVLRQMGYEVPSEHKFRRIIARLRDHSVILASSSQGYKIPSCVRDVVDFVDRTDSIVIPMLNRLQAAREALLLATGGGLDVVADKQFDRLREALESRTLDGSGSRRAQTG